MATVDICILRGSNFPTTSVRKKEPRTFVEFGVDGQHKQTDRTPLHDRSCNPVYDTDRTFTFDLHKDRVHIIVWKSRKLRGNDELANEYITIDSSDVNRVLTKSIQVGSNGLLEITIKVNNHFERPIPDHYRGSNQLCDQPEVTSNHHHRPESDPSNITHSRPETHNTQNPYDVNDIYNSSNKNPYQNYTYTSFDTPY